MANLAADVGGRPLGISAAEYVDEQQPESLVETARVQVGAERNKEMNQRLDSNTGPSGSEGVEIPQNKRAPARFRREGLEEALGEDR